MVRLISNCKSSFKLKAFVSQKSNKKVYPYKKNYQVLLKFQEVNIKFCPKKIEKSNGFVKTSVIFYLFSKSS